MTKRQPVCSKCGQRLTDPYSIAVGMGPECRGAAAGKGAHLPRPNWKVQGGRVMLTGLTLAEPLPGKMEQGMSQQTWMKDETDDLALAHWVKIWGQRFYTCACNKILPRFGAAEVETRRIGLASAPGRGYDAPAQAQACEVCLQKAKQQA